MNDSLGDCGFYCAGAAVSCRPPRPAFAAGRLRGGENANCSKLVARGIGNANRAGWLWTAKGEDSMLWAQTLCLLTALSVLCGMDIFAMICVCAQRRERELQQVGFVR